jgi:hypothetical protein
MKRTNKTSTIAAIEERINLRKFEKLNNSEKDNYLIENKIYVQFNDVNNITNNIFKEKNYSFKLYKKINNLSYQVNAKIIEDFLDYLFGHYLNSKTEINILKFYCNQKLNKKDKIKFIKKEYKKNLKIIESKPEYRLLTGQEYEGAQTLQFHIIFHPNFANILYSHICGLTTIEVLKLEKKWSEGIIAKNIMEFCKEELQNIKEKNNSKNAFNFQIFKSLEKEEIFHKLLIKENVIDEKNIPKHRFKTVTYNTFNIIDRIKNEFFSTNQLNTFVEFLEKKYNFKNKNKTKFANKNSTLSSEIEKFIIEELKKLKNSQNSN